MDGFADFDPISFQEAIKSEYDQVSESARLTFHVVHQTGREVDGQGVSIASRWPLRADREVNLNVTPRTGQFACTALVAEIDAPDPVGPLLFVNHLPKRYERLLSGRVGERQSPGSGRHIHASQSPGPRSGLASRSPPQARGRPLIAGCSAFDRLCQRFPTCARRGRATVKGGSSLLLKLKSLGNRRTEAPLQECRHDAPASVRRGPSGAELVVRQHETAFSGYGVRPRNFLGQAGYFGTSRLLRHTSLPSSVPGG
jgi:hypothetical protein